MIQALERAVAGWDPGRRYLMGVSGGRDSVALLHALVQLGFKRIVVCHVNHMLRGRAAAADERFSGRLAAKMGLQFEPARFDTRARAKDCGLSLESAARALRLGFFTAVGRRRRCPRVILAHHADDQIETILFNLIRGCGAAGLAGMRMESAFEQLTILRPMLGVTRAEIDRYVEGNRLRFREDASNRSRDHSRNRLRHMVIPEIEAAFGCSFRASILRAAEILRAENEWMASLVPSLGATLSCEALRSMPLGLRRRVVKSWLADCRIADAGFQEIERVLSLLDAAGGPAKINLPRGMHAWRRSGEIFVEQG